jgi:hypothetical protein
MRRWIPRLDGALLAGVGVYMLALAGSEAYTLFMNPKFQWLTTVTGVVLCIAGVVFLLWPCSAASPSRTLMFTVFGLILVISGTAELRRPPAFAAKPPAPAVEAPSPYLSLGGKAYLKMNPARLVLNLMSAATAPVEKPIVARGVVRRSPQLDAAGRFGLFRVNMVCCLADAMAMGVMVSAENSGHLKNGDWVTVFGVMKTLPEPLKVADVGRIDDVPYTLIYDSAVLIAEGVKPIDRPRVPYVFELPPSGRATVRMTGEDDDY